MVSERKPSLKGTGLHTGHALTVPLTMSWDICQCVQLHLYRAPNSYNISSHDCIIIIIKIVTITM